MISRRVAAAQSHDLPAVRRPASAGHFGTLGRSVKIAESRREAGLLQRVRKVFRRPLCGSPALFDKGRVFLPDRFG